jgi:hypothetical protein
MTSEFWVISFCTGAAPLSSWIRVNLTVLIDLSFITLQPPKEGEGFADLHGSLRETLIGLRNVFMLSNQFHSKIFCSIFYSRLNWGICSENV